MIEHGGWYYGRIYERNCDVSYDGAWWVFGAYGRYDGIVETEQERHKRAWTGVARLPGFDLAELHPGYSTLVVGGFFASPDRLAASRGPQAHSLHEVPFTVSRDGIHAFGFNERLEREGWHREGPRPQRVRRYTHKDYASEYPNDPGWRHRSADGRLTLRLFERGFNYPRTNGYNFDFRIDEVSDFLDEHVTWACFDKDGRLLVARSGRVELYASSDDVIRNEPSFVHDLEKLMPPSKGTES
ncbi:MAG: hypothetical protein R3B46_05145 [Phycisphaerales bacterium]